MENRLRVKKSALNLVDGKLFYEEKPFTGVTFDVQDEFVVSADIVERGVITGEYQNGYFDIPEDALLMTEDNPILDWSNYNYLPQVKHDDKFVNGVIYLFADGVCTKDGVRTKVPQLANGVCTKETLLINGWEEVELEWHRNGVFKMYFNWPEQHVGGGFVFDNTSRLTRFTVGKGENLKLAVDFSGENTIEKLGLNKDFFAVDNEITNSLPFQFITKISDLLEYRSGEEIWFSEDGITDELIDLLFSNGFFVETSEMHFFNTAISNNAVKKITLIPNLHKIKIHDQHGTLGSSMQELKHQRPEVKVEYEFELK